MLRNLLKKSRIYRFFNNNFKMLNEAVQNQDVKLRTEINLLKEQLEIVNKRIDNYYTETINAIYNIEYNIEHNIELCSKNVNMELINLKKTEKQKVLVVGFYGAPNLGDELMLQSVLNKMDATKTAITVMLADNPNYKLLNYSNINYIHYPKTNMDINIMANYFDKIVFGGGALIEDKHFDEPDAYKHNTATILIELSMAAISNNKKVYCLGLSTSKELSNEKYKTKLEYIIDKADYFSLRDKNSVETLKKSGLKNTKKIKIINDLAMSLPDREYTLKNNKELTVGMVLVGFSEQEMLKNIIRWTHDYFKEQKKSAKIKCIPFYDYNHCDINELTKLVKSLELEDVVEVLPYFQAYNDIAEVFLECDLIVTMRYHASVLALKFGIPSIHIIYDFHPHYENKMNALKEKYEIHDAFISCINMNKESFINSINYVTENMKKISKKEQDVSKKIEKTAVEEHMNVINKILED